MASPGLVHVPQVDQALQSDFQFVVDTPAPPAPPQNGATLAFAGVALVAICHFDVVLNGAVLADILQGTITTWLHPAVKALNPRGINNSAHGALTAATQQIELLRGPAAGSPELDVLMQTYNARYSGAAIKAARAFADEEALQSAVVQNLYALSVTPLSGFLALEPVRFQRRDGAIVSASWQAVEACATPDVMDADGAFFDLQRSSAAACYPLSVSTTISIRRPDCDAADDLARRHAVAFVEWMYSANIAAALHQMNMVPLHKVSATTTAANRAALDFISCNPKVAPLGPSCPPSSSNLPSLSPFRRVFCEPASHAIKFRMICGNGEFRGSSNCFVRRTP